MKHPHIRLALVCTSGGHFEQMRNLSDFYRMYSHFWITAPTTQTQTSLEGETAYFIPMAHFKRPWTYFYQLPILIRVFIREKPTHLVSTGSGRIVFVPFLISRVTKAKFIHIETFSHVNSLTKMGRFLSKMGSTILSQWKGLEEEGSIYVGPVIRNERLPGDAREAEEHIFVTVGTRAEPFPRIIQAVEGLVQEGLITKKVIIQAGWTKYKSTLVEIFDFGTPKQIDELILGAQYVITQESAGIVTKCLKYQKKFIVMPRDYSYNELPTKSDMTEDLHLRLEQMGYTFVVHDISNLKKAIGRIASLKVGFPFDNSLAIATLRRLVGA